MKNQYGVPLDRNGYAPSIAGESDRCFVCGRRDRALQRHEVVHGAFRTKSKNLGLWVNVCDLCHDQIHHHNAAMDLKMKQDMQALAMKHYKWEIGEWLRNFGKNYI